MHVSVSLLFLFLGSTSALKQGDFGIFTACTKDKGLRLECNYANCSNSAPFDCEITGTQPKFHFKGSNTSCWHLIPGHFEQYRNVTTNYNCTLTRRKRREDKWININYSTKKRNEIIKPCRGSSGLLLHRGPGSVWPELLLTLWTVVITDRLTVKL